MIETYTITAWAENKPGVLYRIADLFLRRKINIESLTVSTIKAEDMSRFTIVVQAEQDFIEKIVKQLYRIIEVEKVIEKKDEELIIREVALFKVSATTTERRSEIEQIARLKSAHIISVHPEWLLIEQTGTEEDIEQLHNLLKPVGIQEFVQSGRIVIFT